MQGNAVDPRQADTVPCKFVYASMGFAIGAIIVHSSRRWALAKPSTSSPSLDATMPL